jgi:diamine N-acetyltransferase
MSMTTLAPVTSDNWRDVAGLRVAEHQRRWVADVTYYLCLSVFGGLWRSCAVVDDEGTTVGHVMWAVDPDDGSHWIGGLVIGTAHQGRGLGRATVESLMGMWEEQEPSLSGRPYQQAALSVAPDNESALRLYRSLGFVETGELSDDELVLRRARGPAGHREGSDEPDR